jgi:hypothetical protein
MRRGRATTPIPQLSPDNLVDEERWQQRLAELAEYRDFGAGLAQPQEHGHGRRT